MQKDKNCDGTITWDMLIRKSLQKAAKLTEPDPRPVIDAVMERARKLKEGEN